MLLHKYRLTIHQLPEDFLLDLVALLKLLFSRVFKQKFLISKPFSFKKYLFYEFFIRNFHLKNDFSDS